MSDPVCLDPLLCADPRAALQFALELLREVLEARDRYDELVERLEHYLLTQIEYLDTKEYASSPAGPGRPGRSGRPGLPVARRLKIQRNHDGSGMVEIDEEKPFRLSAGLTDFLQHLASDEAASDDMLVAWKPRASLWEWLRKYSGRDVDAQYVNKRVDDLRRTIRDAGIERKLVHSHRSKGVRFALRRSSRLTPRVVGGVGSNCG